jgi:hypothetical protein
MLVQPIHQRRHEVNGNFGMSPFRGRLSGKPLPANTCGACSCGAESKAQGRVQNLVHGVFSSTWKMLAPTGSHLNHADATVRFPSLGRRDPLGNSQIIVVPQFENLGSRLVNFRQTPFIVRPTVESGRYRDRHMTESNAWRSQCHSKMSFELIAENRAPSICP